MKKNICQQNNFQGAKTLNRRIHTIASEYGISQKKYMLIGILDSLIMLFAKSNDSCFVDIFCLVVLRQVTKSHCLGKSSMPFHSLKQFLETWQTHSNPTTPQWSCFAKPICSVTFDLKNVLSGKYLHCYSSNISDRCTYICWNSICNADKVWLMHMITHVILSCFINLSWSLQFPPVGLGGNGWLPVLMLHQYLLLPTLLYPVCLSVEDALCRCAVAGHEPPEESKQVNIVCMSRLDTWVMHRASMTWYVWGNKCGIIEHKTNTKFDTHFNSKIKMLMCLKHDFPITQTNSIIWQCSCLQQLMSALASES